MNEFEIVKHIMMLNGISYDEFSERLGYKSNSTSYHRLNGKHLYVDTWRRFLDELGYEIIVREKSKDSGGYVVTDDNLPSPLRFRGMELGFESIFGDAPPTPKKRPIPTVNERKRLSRELKERVSELTFDECDKALLKIWETRGLPLKGEHTLSEYREAYEKYREEFLDLYRLRR